LTILYHISHLFIYIICISYNLAASSMMFIVGVIRECNTCEWSYEVELGDHEILTK